MFEDDMLHYWGGRFFSRNIRANLQVLHSFVVIVGAQAENRASYRKFERQWNTKKAPTRLSANTFAIKEVKEVVQKNNIDSEWLNLFIETKRNDAQNVTPTSFKQLLKYMHGTSEALAIISLNIVNPHLPKDGTEQIYEYAFLQARSLQYMNFIREIGTDSENGRTRFPQKELDKFGLKSLKINDVRRHQAEFREFTQAQIARYYQWQKEANKIYRFVPWRERIVLRANIDIYNWMAKKITTNPTIVFEKTLKPSGFRAMTYILLRCIYA